MSDIIAYKEKLWKVIHDYKYTGECEELTIDPGKYLLVCHGASGGIGYGATNIPKNYGGVSMGVINLTSPTDMFIYVGGNGGDSLANNNQPGLGGFNGGADGGLAGSSSYAGGAGGGGASDIRIGVDDVYARVIVAGGAGGGTNADSTTVISYNGFGGGPNGGLVVTKENEDPTWLFYASQTSGYSFGGTAQIPVQKDSNGGAGGGGGGWYTGYSSQRSGDGSSRAGGGGSGYVLTADSHKPEGYLLGEEYYLTDTYLGCGEAEEPCVKICSEISPKHLSANDVITFPSIGDVEHISLPIGTYTMKCYGGFGGYRYFKGSAPRGGYAQGTIKLNSFEDIYVRVGGSGYFGYVAPQMDTHVEYNAAVMANRGFNGGGLCCKQGDIRAAYGGGASDIRIGVDDVYARVIVAGGAGGHGSAEQSGSRFGGAGGGESGDKSSGSNYGTVLGPGTQTESPADTNSYGIGGGFGYGGNAVAQTSDQFPGPGGGGWYGGSGCRSDNSSDDDRGGCGGSGYVLTADSHKPEGYLLGEEYYLTDTILTTGGNNLPYDHTKVIIEVKDVQVIPIICKDAEGFKTFNTEENKWVYCVDSSTELTSSLFEIYGSYSFKNDDGLLNEYEVFILDEPDLYESGNLLVVPNKQTITKTIKSGMYIKHTTFDADPFDESEYQMNIAVSRQGYNNDATMTLQIDIDKNVPDESKSTDLSLYCVSVFSQ